MIRDTDDTSGNERIPSGWLEEFDAAAKRSLETRFRYSFIKTYKPVLDDASYRSFDTMEQYRKWCEDNLPVWLGYGRATVDLDEMGSAPE
jgi:hypothetical protein